MSPTRILAAVLAVCLAGCLSEPITTPLRGATHQGATHQGLEVSVLVNGRLFHTIELDAHSSEDVVRKYPAFDLRLRVMNETACKAGVLITPHLTPRRTPLLHATLSDWECAHLPTAPSTSSVTSSVTSPASLRHDSAVCVRVTSCFLS
jgi:hypothetical protein